MMKKFFFPLVLLCSCVALPLHAASAMAPNAVATQPAAGRHVEIYVIDMDRCMRESTVGKEKTTLLEKKERDLTARSEQMGSDLRQKSQEIEQKAAMLSPDVLNRKRKEFERLSEDYRLEFEQMRAEYDQLGSAIMQEMNEFIMPVKKIVSDKLRGAAIVDQRMFIEVGMLPDCTDMFIAEMNAAYKAKTVAQPAATSAAVKA